MMRALIWTEFYWPSVGGGEMFTMNLIRGLRARGFEFAVVTGRLTDSLPASEEVDGIPIRRFPFRPAIAQRDLSRLRDIRRDLRALIESFAPDLLHMTWMGPCGIIYHQLQAERPLPTLITLGQHLRGDISPDSLRGRTLRRATWVAACATWMRAALLRHVPELGQRSSVVYHAVPPPARATDAPAEARLLCLGRLVPAKGFDVALRAFAKIASAHSSAQLVIAGEGPERSLLENLSVELGVAGRVAFVGRVRPEDAAALIATSALVLMPSREETFGLVALETAQQSRPIVASGVEGLAEVVADGETGVLVPPGDGNALARAVMKLLGDPERRARMGRRASQRAATRFSWQGHLDAYAALYRQCGSAGAR